MKPTFAITLATVLSLATSLPVAAVEPAAPAVQAMSAEVKSRFVVDYIMRAYTVKPVSTVTSYAARALGQAQKIILPEISTITAVAPDRLRVRFVVDTYPLAPGGVATSTIRVVLVDLGRQPPTPDNTLGLAVSAVTVESEESVTR